MNARAARDTLHLTNGTSIIPKMQAAGVQGQIVPWDDVLHEGPVPAGLGTAALRERRAEFLASCGWGSRDEIARDLEARDVALDEALGGANRLRQGYGGQEAPPLHAPSAAPQHGAVDEIVLWFEHDLYDQLHLLQILDRLPVDGGPRVTAVPAPTYLGHLPVDAYPRLFEGRRPVSSAERMAARDAWTAFRSADPHAIAGVLPRVTIFPYLGSALRRHLEQFPSVFNGLSRTEQQTLEAVVGGASRLSDVFVASNHNREEAFFMGDAAFLFHISSLIKNPRPLLRTLDRERSLSQPSALDQHVELTADGARVLSGELDRVEWCGIDRWLGGVCLLGNGSVWRWDHQRQSIRFA